MCGFIGILTRSPQLTEQFNQGLAAVRDRGITTGRTCTAGECYGYSRLPTDDVTNAGLNSIDCRKPMLLYNGLITNVEYLVDAYKLPLAVKRADSLCLREGLAQYGPAFVEQARGMFAFADCTAHSITLVRDTVGIKPLYYTHSRGLFAFASEHKALVHIGQPIHEVQPGQIITFSKRSGRLKKQRFAYRSYCHYRADDLEACLREAVVQPTERYMKDSNKPVALLLSGGLDSSVTARLLTASLPAAYRQRLMAFCVGEPEAPDTEAAQKLAGELGLQLVQVRPFSDSESLQRLPEIVYKAESPHARVIKVALLYEALAIRIKEHGIDIAIGGEGADELFHGYHRFIDGLTYAQSDRLFRRFFGGVFPSTLLQRLDRIMARHQLEGRVPYLDQELVELAHTIPAERKVRYHAAGHTSKLPLRTVARHIGLPAYIHSRPKEKMTSGATGRQNNTATDGYLEQPASALVGLPFQELVSLLYRLQFGKGLAVGAAPTTEEQLMEQVEHYRRQNMKTAERSYA